MLQWLAATLLPEGMSSWNSKARVTRVLCAATTTRSGVELREALTEPV